MHMNSAFFPLPHRTTLQFQDGHKMDGGDKRDFVPVNFYIGLFLFDRSDLSKNYG